MLFDVCISQVFIDGFFYCSMYCRALQGLGDQLIEIRSDHRHYFGVQTLFCRLSYFAKDAENGVHHYSGDGGDLVEHRIIRLG